MSQPHLFRKSAFRPHVLLNFLEMVKVVRKGNMDVSERNRGNLRNDFVWCHSWVFMPTNYVEHSNPGVNPENIYICKSLRNLVGLPGFEPGTSCTPSKRASQAAPQPES